MQSVDLPSDQSPILIHEAELPFCFSSGSPLDPCELLFYACLKTEFQEKAFKSRYYDKYENVSRVIDIVYKRKYSTVSMRNFIYRTNNGVGISFGKEKGSIQRYFYCEHICKLIEQHKMVIASLLSKSNESFSSLEITELTGFIDQLCCSAKKFLEQENGIIDDETKLNHKIVDSQMKAILKNFDSWSYLLDGRNDILHLYYFKKSRNLQMYLDLEILVENNGMWQLMLERKLRKIGLEWADIPFLIQTTEELTWLIESVQNFSVCHGQSPKNILFFVTSLKMTWCSRPGQENLQLEQKPYYQIFTGKQSGQKFVQFLYHQIPLLDHQKYVTHVNTLSSI